MKEMKTLTLNGEQYKITDGDAARIDDTAAAESTTWSGQKISDALDNLGAGVLGKVTPMIDGKIDDTAIAENKTWSSQYINESLNYVNQLHTNWLKLLVDDSNTSEEKTWSSQKLSAELTALQEKDAQQTAQLAELRGYVDDNLLALHDKTDSIINDDTIDGSATWSSSKLYTTLGEVESALDAILAMQNALIGGESV